MAIFKRGSTWHTHFFVDGERFRMSLETTDKRLAKAKEKEQIAAAKEGKLYARKQQFARLGFVEASERYLQSRKPELSEASQKNEACLLVKPRTFFGNVLLGKVTSEQLLAFREWRTHDGVKAATINMEIGVIRRMLKRANVGTSLRKI